MRSLRHDLILAIPAIGMGLFVLAVGALSHETAAIASRYQRQARAAFHKEDFSWALNCYQKAEQFGVPSREMLYEKGLCQQALRQTNAARQTMREVLQRDEEYLPARLWLAATLLRSQAGTEDQRAEAERHIDIVLKNSPSNLMANRLAAEIKSLRHGLEQGLPFLEKLSVVSPADRLRLAEAYLNASLAAKEDNQPGKAKVYSEKANLEANSVLLVVERRLESDPRDMEFRLLGVQACMVRRDFPEAVRLLDAGLRVHGKSRRLKRSLATTLMSWGQLRATGIGARRWSGAWPVVAGEPDSSK